MTVDVELESRVNPYLLGAQIDEFWYVLSEEDVDPNDVMLSRIMEHKLMILAIPNSTDGGDVLYISKCIDGLLLQQLINAQFGLEHHRHRDLTQYREMRDCVYSPPELDNITDLTKWWIDSENAQRFALEYRGFSEQKKELDELRRVAA